MRSRGFSLVELTVVLVIMGLILGLFMGASSTLMNAQRAQTTQVKLRAIDQALVSFVSVNRRLPCPANGSVTAGIEVSPCTAAGSNQVNGVVPWAALGLSASDIEDGWGVRITYRVDPVLTDSVGDPPPLDFSQCDPAGTKASSIVVNGRNTCGPSGTCSSTNGTSYLSSCVTPLLVLNGRGLEVQDAVGGSKLMDPAAVPPTGAAYILISHGENQSGGFSSSGVVQTSTTGVEGNNEVPNRASNVIQAYYVDANQIFSSDATRFDDFVVRPSVLSVVQRAHLGPRSH